MKFIRPHREAKRGVEVQFNSLWTLVLGGVKWTNLRSRRFKPWKDPSVRMKHGIGWAQCWSARVWHEYNSCH